MMRLNPHKIAAVSGSRTEQVRKHQAHKKENLLKKHQVLKEENLLKHPIRIENPKAEALPKHPVHKRPNPYNEHHLQLLKRQKK